MLAYLDLLGVEFETAYYGHTISDESSPLAAVQCSVFNLTTRRL
jgi:hypothetical protein